MTNRSSGEKVVRRPPMEVREATLRALSRLRWQPRTTGADRFAAIWTSRLFRFKDEVTVELAPEKEATRVRARSASRVGRYDFGQNARHVRRFFEELERELGTKEPRESE